MQSAFLRRLFGRNLLAAPVLNALRYRDFRVLGLASLFNAFGAMGEALVLGWLVLEMTDSSFMVGVALGLRSAPMFLLGMVAGSVADMVDRRVFLRALSVVQAMPAASLGALALVGEAGLWHVLVYSFIAGLLQVFQQPVRQSYAYDIAGRAGAMNALSVLMLSMRLGGLAGSLAAGVALARLGPGGAFLGLAASYLAAATVLLWARSPGQAAPVEHRPAGETLRRNLRELRVNRTLLALILMTATVEMVGFSHQVLLPTLARDTFGVGPQGLGVLSGVRSVGGMAGLALLAALGDVRRKGAVVLVVIFAFGVALVALGLVTSFLLALLVLALVNALAALFDVLSQALMQLNVPNELRGRAMGAWVLAIGAGPLGHMQIGALASLTSAALAFTLNGVGLVAVAVLGAALFPRLRRL